jgi:hypothetical protein
MEILLVVVSVDDDELVEVLDEVEVDVLDDEVGEEGFVLDSVVVIKPSDVVTPVIII